MTSRSFAAVILAAALAGTTVAAQRGPAAAAAHLPAEVLALACAPKAALEVPNTPPRVTGGQDSFVSQSHAPGDIVTVNAGSQNGIEVGQEYYTRRVLISNREKITPATPATIMTSGWIKVWAVDDTMSLATITHACDTINVDDHLERLVHLLQPDRRGEAGGTAAHDHDVVLHGFTGHRGHSRGGSGQGRAPYYNCRLASASSP